VPGHVDGHDRGRGASPGATGGAERLVAQAGEHVDAQVEPEVVDAVSVGLEPDDAEAVRRLVRSDYRVDCVTGSGPAIDAAAEAWTAAGHRVLTIDAAAKRHAAVRELLVADEQALARNCIYSRLVAELGSIEVSGVRVAQALTGPVVRHGNTVVAGDRAAQTSAMIEDWQAARDEGASALLVARRPGRVAELAAAARSALVAAGELGAEITAGGRAYAVGDEVRFERDLVGKWKGLHDQMPGVHAGAEATITAVDPETGTITVRTPSDPEAVERWQAAHEQQEREIQDLAGEMARWIERANDQELLGSDREQARARVASARSKLDTRLAQRAAKVAVVDGRR